MSGKPVCYVGDDAASAGLGVFNGGITGSQHPQASGTYPRNANVGEKEAFYRPDVMAAYGKGPRDQQQAAVSTVGHTPLAFRVVANSKLLKGRTAITYSVPGGAGPSFFVKYEGASTLIVHRGIDESGPVIGHIEVPKLKGAWRIRFQLPVSANGGAPPPAYAANPANQASLFSSGSSMTMVDYTPPQLDAKQEFERSGWLHKRYSLALPAVAASLGVRSPTFSWTRSSDHGGSSLAMNWVLIEGEGKGGPEIAAYTKHGFAGNGDAELKLLAPEGLDQPAVEQIVVASVAFVEMKRRESNDTTLLALS